MRSVIKNFAMPLVFLGALLFSLFFGNSLPIDIKSFLYAISVSIKVGLIFVLPFVIFSLVFSSVTKLGASALRYILIIVPLICASNFTNTNLSYFVSRIFSGVIKVTPITQSAVKLEPFFSFQLINPITNDMALLSAAVLGILFGFLKNGWSEKVSGLLDGFSNAFFKILVPIMPFFIVGTALKLQHDGMLKIMCEQYMPVLLVFVGTAYSYVFLQFLILTGFNFARTGACLRNIFPAIVTALGSMSSVAALPMSIKAAEKNLSLRPDSDKAREKSIAGIIVPSTVNIHLVGDCFFIPMLALAVMSSFGMELPSISQYLIFSLHFVLAKFAVAAVSGGGILVMLPIMQAYLGFSSDMLAFITALYVLFDPIITACNVAGNGAMALIFDRISQKKS